MPSSSSRAPRRVERLEELLREEADLHRVGQPREVDAHAGQPDAAPRRACAAGRAPCAPAATCRAASSASMAMRCSISSSVSPSWRSASTSGGASSASLSPIAAPAEVEREQLVEDVGVGAPLDQRRLERAAQQLRIVEARRARSRATASSISAVDTRSPFLRQSSPNSSSLSSIALLRLERWPPRRCRPPRCPRSPPRATTPLRSITTIVGSANT